MSAALIGTVLLSLTASQGSAPLPDLALDAFPPGAREAVAGAWQRAGASPRDAQAAGDLARTLHAWEQWDAAHQAYSRARALAPAAFEWQYLDGIVLQRAGRHAEAADRLRAALAVRPHHLPARVRLAEALLEAGRPADARPLLDALASEPAAAPSAHFGLGRIASSSGDHARAIAHFERAIALFPEFGAAHYALARAYRAAGRAADAARALEQHGRLGARWPGIDDAVLAGVTSLRGDPRALLARGAERAAAGEVADAIALHEAALAGDASLSAAHANLVSLYGRAERWDRVESHYAAALAAGAATADLHYDYGVVQGLQRKWDEAGKAYRQALALNPRHANALNNLGQLFERRLESVAEPAARRALLEEAASHYRLAVEAQPSFRVPRLNLGRMLLALGQPDAAVREFQQLQQPRDAETPRYAFALATALVRAGRREEGVAAAREAQRLAVEFGQSELAAAIARELAALK